jgi:hypothetical protein
MARQPLFAAKPAHKSNVAAWIVGSGIAPIQGGMWRLVTWALRVGF